MEHDYRIDLRNILNRRADFDDVGRDIGLTAAAIEDLLSQRGHIPLETLLRLVEKRGGELAVRPTAIPHLGHADVLAALASHFSSEQLPTNGLRIEGRYAPELILDRNTDLHGLASWVIEKSVPWIACQKRCIASSYCPLAAPRSIWGPAEDDRCGIMANAVGTLVLSVGSTLRVRSLKRLQALVDTARLYADLAMASMQSHGVALSPAVLRGWGTSANSMMHGATLHMAGLGQSVLESWSEIGGSGPRPILWLFEGESERVFFSMLLRAHHDEDFVASRAVNLEGIGSMKHVKLLVRQKRREGMEPLLLLDSGTRRDDNRVASLVKGGLVRRSNIVRFRKDFESSFPEAFVAREYEGLLEPEHHQALAEARRRYRKQESAGFSFELKAALRRAGMPAGEANDYVNSRKVRAAHQMAVRLRSHVGRILGSSARSPEIEGVIRRVVGETRDYRSTRRNARRRIRKGEGDAGRVPSF